MAERTLYQSAPVMRLYIAEHPFHYEMENLCRIFFPYHRIETIPCGTDGNGAHILDYGTLGAYTGMQTELGGIRLQARLFFGGRERIAEERTSLSFPGDLKELERRMGVLLFGLLTQACAYTPKWGILTGVRPIKLLRSLAERMGEEAALQSFQQDWLVSAEKTELSRITMGNEQKILSLSRPESFSLYVSIPFCPTRCSYCSFVSSSVERTAKLIPEYLELLCVEIQHTAEVAKGLGLRLESVYIGGGTPTTLSAEQLAQLLDTITAAFDMSTCREFTVEAGRPDTITAEKLKAMLPRGVTRISINPQTLNDHVLETIGRRHTAAQTLEAFSLARACGYDDINMDLIVGLPEDTLESFQETMQGVLALHPESITVHTLSLKRSARIFQDDSEPFSRDAALAGDMLDWGDAQLLQHGYTPYYLYRQSRMVGNLENTGWAKQGKESLYNVYIMDETHTILACGAGAVTKVRDPYSDQLKRIFNFKYPYEYIRRHGEMLTRKEQVRTIYEEYWRARQTLSSV